MGEPVTECTARLQQQEQEIQNLTAEFERLKNQQNMNTSAHLEELQEENTRLKYRINILKRVIESEGKALPALKMEQIQNLTAEIERLKNQQNMNVSECLEELQEENTRLKYRINILKRVIERKGEVPSAPKVV